ncbi:hypothetical protein V8C26DRAFT_401327 [Trichoderma gracile]
MPSSSTNAVYDGSDNGINHPNAINGSNSQSDPIGRFLADQEQHRPLQCSGPVQPAAVVEAAAKARMLAKLNDFQQRFDSGNEQRAT